MIEQGLKDSDPVVRAQALRLADERLARSESVRRAVAMLADDSSPRVRFQLAFTLGEADAPEVIAALAKVARLDVADPWTQTAVLSSAGRTARALLEAFAHDKQITTSPSADHLQFLSRLAALVAARNSDADLASVLGLLGEPSDGAGGAWQVALLTGLGQGLQNTPRPLSRLWEAPPRELKDAVEKARPFFQRAAITARDAKASAADRGAAARLLAAGPYALAAPALQELSRSAKSGGGAARRRARPVGSRQCQGAGGVARRLERLQSDAAPRGAGGAVRSTGAAVAPAGRHREKEGQQRPDRAAASGTTPQTSRRQTATAGTEIARRTGIARPPQGRRGLRLGPGLEGRRGAWQVGVQEDLRHLPPPGERGRRGRPGSAVGPAQQVEGATAQRHSRSEPRGRSALHQLCGE